MTKTVAVEVLAVVLLIVAGCVPPPETVHLESEFDAERAKRLIEPGSNTIKGRAFLRTANGDVVHCGGYEVRLIPKTQYATERMAHLFRSVQDGFNRDRRFQFSPEYKGYRRYTRSTICDNRGQFTFENVADGEFYLVTDIVWFSNRLRNGGSLMKRVTVSGTETVEVILSSK